MKQRFFPLDVFRGITVAFMILVNNPGSWSQLYAPLGHARWHGYTPTDLVFPFFLFAVGNALSFVIPGLEQKGNGAFWQKTIKRTCLIFLIGLLLNWFPFVKYDNGGVLVAKAFSDLRIMGVLQRIALCYFFASAIIYYGKAKGAIISSVMLLAGYWWLCVLFGAADPYSLEGWFGLDIDKRILGESHLYKGEGVPFDPEGIASTIPAIVQVIAGYLVGNIILKNLSAFQTGQSKALIRLSLLGLFCLSIGLIWDPFFPINKKIWTSSYVLVSTGWAILLLTAIIYITEVLKIRGWGRFFDVFGKNPLFIFVLSGVIVRIYGLFRIPVEENGTVVYKGLGKWGYDAFFAPVFGALNGSLVYAVFHVLLLFAVTWLLDRKKVYIRL